MVFEQGSLFYILLLKIINKIINKMVRSDEGLCIYLLIAWGCGWSGVVLGFLCTWSCFEMQILVFEGRWLCSVVRV